jgi:Bacterial HORMA domain family 1
MMTGTGTRTAAFTITDARYVGAKIGADLRLLHALYGHPDLASIGNFVEEAALLLRDGYLRTVDYGFYIDAVNAWKLRFRYTATAGGALLDSRPGSLPTTAAVAGYDFCSYLIYSAAYHALSAFQRAAVLDRLPVQRVAADEPTTGAGHVLAGHGYARNGIGVTRDTYISI